ncbi:putative conserved membrane protein [Mycobacterium kansasii]|uniref:Putative conserved membrane protein n=1 Tax=Mycobacterium kansasii TaxID=1768 RepID=A0A1V3WAE0_MYCKA|nr:putative conserved membrane protein [Mycobacterium kansasii]
MTVENIADFVSAYIIGNLLQMAFRFWAFRRWVFPDEFARNPDKALESALTAGGIAEVLEDTLEGGNVTLLRAWRSKRSRTGRLAQLGASSEPRVSKTS